MYVCLCYGVTADEIRESISNSESLQDMQSKLRVGTCCGCCMKEVEGILSCKSCDDSIIEQAA